MKEIDITKDNFEDVAKIYEGISAKLKLKFSDYYKYSFSFYGEADDIWIYVSYGGNADDIWRFNVNATEEITAPKTLKDLFDKYFYISIEDKKNEVEYTSYHY